MTRHRNRSGSAEKPLCARRSNFDPREPVTPSRTEIRDPEALFAYDLAGVYDMELKLVDALAEMSRTATNDNLSKGFALHRTETRGQVERVEAAFEALGVAPERREDPVIDGLLADRERFEARVTDDRARNLYHLAAATKTEQIEITRYERLLLTAEKAGFGDDVTGPLADNLEQEEKTFRKLRGLSWDSTGEAIRDVLTGT